MKIGYLKRKEFKKISSLLFNYEFDNYRNYRIFNKEQRMKYLLEGISDSLDGNNYVIIAKNNDDIIGLASLNKLIWDTAHFGLGLAKIDYLITKGSYHDSVTIKNKLLSFILRLCKQKGIKHLSCKVDTSDYSTIHCLEEKGFQLMDNLATYILITQGYTFPYLKDLYHIRKFEENDLDSLIRIIKENLWINRFYIDFYLPKDKTVQLYVEWLRNCCQGKLADEVLVAERSKNILGFFTYKLDERLKRITGIKCLGRGISAVSPQAKGAYVSLLKSAIERGKFILKVDLGEFETQIWNYSVIKIYQRFGMNFVNSKYTFRKWLGNPK